MDGFNFKIADHVRCETHIAGVRSSEAGSPLPAAPIEIDQSETAGRLTETMKSTQPNRRSSPSAPIGLPEMEDQQQPTSEATKPNVHASAAAPIAAKPKAKRRQKVANESAKPTQHAPPSAPIGHVSNGVAGDEGQKKRETHLPAALVATVNLIVELQSIRRFCIKSQSRCDRSIESLIARYLGYHTDLDEKNRKALFRRAGEIRKQVEKGGGDQSANDTHGPNVPAGIYPMIRASALARAVWDEKRKEAEKDMERAAKHLPVWPWVEQVRGLGARGLAILVGEAGIPIGEYRTVSGLWSRLGLSVIGGIRQQRKAGADGLVHKFSPGRRAEVWAVCSDSLFRAQWRGADEDTGESAHPIGLYGEVYARRRAITAERMQRSDNLPANDPDKWTKGRCHNDARRVMTKELMKDLWIEWRRAARSEA